VTKPAPKLRRGTPRSLGGYALVKDHAEQVGVAILPYEAIGSKVARVPQAPSVAQPLPVRQERGDDRLLPLVCARGGHSSRPRHADDPVPLPQLLSDGEVRTPSIELGILVETQHPVSAGGIAEEQVLDIGPGDDKTRHSVTRSHDTQPPGVEVEQAGIGSA